MIWSVFQTVAAVAVSSARPQHSSIPTSRSISAQSSNIIRVHSIQPYKTTIAYYCLWLVTSSLTSSSSSWLNLRGVVAAPTSTDRRICSWKNLDRNSRFYSTSNTRSSFSGSSRSRIHRFGQRQQKQQQYSRRTMSSFLTRRTEGTITVAPKIEGDQSALVVIAHGLGDTAEGFADVAEMMAKAMPHVKFILPTAPTQPVTMNMGMAMPSWYDITGLDERSNENCAGLPDSVATIQGILQREHEMTGLPYERMILAGFSQGGALSLFTSFQLPQQIAGVVVMSGYLPAARQFTISPGLHTTPVLHCHGTQDMVVPYVMAEKSVQKVREAGVTDYTFKSYPIGHTVDPRTELVDVMAFVQEKLPADAKFNIKVKEASVMSVKELREAIRNAGLSHKAVGLMEKPEFVKLLQEHRDGKL